MMNEYQYIDPDSLYTDPATEVLRNLGGITDRAALTFAETAATTKRARELKTAPIRVTDSGFLFAIHRHLFQDIYEWAGKQRTVEISKGGKQFFPLSYFPNAIKSIDSLLFDRYGINQCFLSRFPDLSNAKLGRELGVRDTTVFKWRHNIEQVVWERLKYAIDTKGVTWDWLIEGV